MCCPAWLFAPGCLSLQEEISQPDIDNRPTCQGNGFQTTTNRKTNYTVVHYHFIASNGRQYTGSLTTRPGQHRVSEVIEVFYLPDNPHNNTVKGTWNDNWFLLFVIAIALAVLNGMYQLYEMVNKETL
jgi:hypothetical protein